MLDFADYCPTPRGRKQILADFSHRAGSGSGHRGIGGLSALKRNDAGASSILRIAPRVEDGVIPNQVNQRDVLRALLCGRRFLFQLA